MVHRRIQARGILGGAIAGSLVVRCADRAARGGGRVIPGAAAAPGQRPAADDHADPRGQRQPWVPLRRGADQAQLPGAPTINLAHFGYVEREFTMSGTTNIYRQSGFWGSNGVWNVSVAQSNVPYTTRLLVRYPTNPAKFNGTVVVEWLNDTTGGDQDPVWSEIYHEALSQGYAYVGVSAQTGSMVEDKTWDPQRYGALGDTNDGQSYDIFSQAAQVARSTPRSLLGGLHPTTIIGSGDSQSAFRVATYYNAIQPLSHAFDGFLAVGRSGARRADRHRPGRVLAVPGARPHRQSRRRSSRSRPRATSRSWGSRSPGSPTTPTCAPGSWPGPRTSTCTRAQYEGATIAARGCRSLPAAATACSACPPTGRTQPDNMGVFELEDSALVALRKWITQGVAPPSGNQIATTPFFNIVERDQYGNALGGIRLPDINVPTETYSAINFSQPSQEGLSPSQLFTTLENIFSTLMTGVITDPTLRDEGLCLLEGFYTPFGRRTLQSLYPTHAAYVSQFTAAAQADLAAGFLTRYDYNQAVKAAQAAPIP